MSYVTLNEMRSLVENHTPFSGNSVYATYFNGLYTVFSYGSHFPMYVYDADAGWVGNESKYSTTTSKHQSKCRPNNVRLWLYTEQMHEVLQHGSYTKYVVLRGEAA